MEEEERAAQSAKLQELIRRGGPEDLQEANRLMKVMAGYDTRNRTDYRAKAAEEVSKVQQKAKILEEMLQGYKEGDKMAEGDVFEASVIMNFLGNETHSVHRSLQMHCKARSLRFRRCAKKSLRIKRQSQNCWKSMIASTEQSKDIN